MWQEGISFAMGLPCRDHRGYGREGICHQIKVAELHQLPSDLPRRIFAYFEYGEHRGNQIPELGIGIRSGTRAGSR